MSWSRERVLAGDRRRRAGDLLEQLAGRARASREKRSSSARTTRSTSSACSRELRVPLLPICSIDDAARRGQTSSRPIRAPLDGARRITRRMHVAAALVRRVDRRRRRGTSSRGRGRRARGAPSSPSATRRRRRRSRCDPVHDRLVAVGVEDRVDALQQHRAALQPDARVDVLLRQRRQRAVRVRGRTP